MSVKPWRCMCSVYLLLDEINSLQFLLQFSLLRQWSITYPEMCVRTAVPLNAALQYTQTLNNKVSDLPPLSSLLLPSLLMFKISFLSMAKALTPIFKFISTCFSFLILSHFILLCFASFGCCVMQVTY